VLGLGLNIVHVTAVILGGRIGHGSDDDEDDDGVTVN